MRSRSAGSALAFAVAFGATLAFALPGGSYDIVTRQETALLIWAALALGLGLGLFPRARLPRLATLPLAAAVGLAAWTALSLSWSESDHSTLAEVARVLQYAGLIALIWCVVDANSWRAAAAGLLAGAVVVCSIAVGHRLFHGGASATERAFSHGRLAEPFNYWNGLAAWGAMTITMALAWSAHAGARIARSLTLAAVPLCGLAVYLTYSRAGVIGIVLGLLAVVALGPHRGTTAVHALAAAAGSTLVLVVARGQPQIASPGDGTGAVAVLAALVVAGGACAAVAAATLRTEVRLAPRIPQPYARRLLLTLALAAMVFAALAGPPLARRAWDEFKAPVTATGSDPAGRLTTLGGKRYEVWSGALDAFRDAPLKGIGAGSFEFWWSRHTKTGTFERDAHSLYLEQLAELGLPGLALTLLLVGGLLYLGICARARAAPASEAGARTALLAALIVFLFHAGVDWMWELTAVGALGLACGALAAASGIRPAPPPRPRVPLRAALAALAVVAFIVELPGLVSVSKLRDSQAAAAAGAPERARADAVDAADAEPWAAGPRVQLALLAESADELRLARRELHEAIEREPTNWRHRLLAARIEAELGDERRALAAIREARRLRPRSAFLRGDNSPLR